MSRSFKRWLARTLIGVVLFGQFAIAAYACPGLASALEQARQNSAAIADEIGVALASQTPLATAAVDSMVDCDQMPAPMDGTSPNLCSEHCRQGDRSDHAGTIILPAVLLTSLYMVSPPAHARPVQWAHSRADLYAALSPPHAILHCCLRD